MVGAAEVGRVAVVTGGASGIGLALGTALLAGGAHVVLADVDGPAAAAAADALAALPTAGGSVRGVALDVRDLTAVRMAVNDVVDRHGRIDLMVNNAGIALGGHTHLMPPEHWDRAIDVNLRGVVHGVIASYPQMVAQGHGHIVNVASMAGLAPTPMTAPYAMTKHGVVGLSTTLRPEAALHGVRVTVVCPGAIETPILDKPVPADLPPSPSGTLTAREFLSLMRMRPMDADRFAARALRGIDRNRAIVIVPASGKGLWYLQRLAPRAVDRIGKMLAARIARHAPPAPPMA